MEAKAVSTLLWMFLYFAISTIDGQTYMKCSYFSNPLYLTAHRKTQTIQIPTMDRHVYLPDQHCEWVIRTEISYHVVHLVIKKQYLEGKSIDAECVRDYLEFLELKESGEHAYLGRYCGQDTTHRVLETTSPSSQMLIIFVSNTLFNYQGFEITYTSAEQRPSDETEEKGSLEALIVGISVGLVSVIVAVAIVIFFYRRWFPPKNRRPNNSNADNSSSEHRRNRMPWQEGQEPNTQPRGSSAQRDGHHHHHHSNSYNEIPSNRSSQYYDYNASSSHGRNSLEQPGIGEDDPRRGRDGHVIDLRPRPGSHVWPPSSSSPSTFLPASDANSSLGNGGGGGDGGFRSGRNSGVGVNADDNGRSRTPPPSYEFTVMYDRMIQEGGAATILPMQLPDYDFVVNENQLTNCDVDNSQV